MMDKALEAEFKELVKNVFILVDVINKDYKDKAPDYYDVRVKVFLGDQEIIYAVPEKYKVYIANIFAELKDAFKLLNKDSSNQSKLNAMFVEIKLNCDSIRKTMTNNEESIHAEGKKNILSSVKVKVKNAAIDQERVRLFNNILDEIVRLIETLDKVNIKNDAPSEKPSPRISTDKSDLLRRIHDLEEELKNMTANRDEFEGSARTWKAYADGRVTALNKAKAELASLKEKYNALEVKFAAEDSKSEPVEVPSKTVDENQAFLDEINKLKETLMEANARLDLQLTQAAVVESKDLTPKFFSSQDLLEADSNFNHQLDLLNIKISAEPDTNKKLLLEKYANQLNQIDRSDKDCLDAGTYGIQCVITKIDHPDADIKPIHLEHQAHTSSSKWKKIAGIVMMTGAVLLGLTSLALIATIKLSPAGIAGLTGSAALFALGASKVGGITLLGIAIGSGVGLFGGDKLRQKAGETSNLSDAAAAVIRQL